MNILMVHPHDLFSSLEPWTVRIRAIAEEFAKKGHSVRLCYFPLEKKGTAPHASGAIELYPLDRSLSPRALFENTRRLTGLAGWADIVHFQKSHHYASVPAVAAAFILGKPLHYDWDDWEEKIFFESCRITYKTFFIGHTFKVLERILPVLADTVSVASRQLEHLAVKAGKKPEDIFFAPVGVDLDKFRPGLDAAAIREKYNISGPLVLYIGQLHGAQYVDLLLGAANIVLHKNPDVRFMVVGDGFSKSRLKEHALRLGIGERVIFTGAVGHDLVPSYIAAADICTAVFKDTDVTRCKSPLKIVEYMACGKPIVASDVGEVRSMLAGVGMLVAAGDAGALAEGIITLLEDEDMRRGAGEVARKRAEGKYTWSKTADNLLCAYRKAQGI
ncbi:MAG TPA: hypothetical protein DCL35_01875 [Candidatus Omnitrophica bacterium]|nr:hypothetical protein [Candidatus Omnitrophota bacterium]